MEIRLNYHLQNYQHYLNQLSFEEFKLHVNSKNLKEIENYDLEIIYKDILSRITSSKKINEEIINLINFFHKKQTVDIDDQERDLIKKTKQIREYHVFGLVDFKIMVNR